MSGTFEAPGSVLQLQKTKNPSANSPRVQKSQALGANSLCWVTSVSLLPTSAAAVFLSSLVFAHTFTEGILPSTRQTLRVDRTPGTVLGAGERTGSQDRQKVLSSWKPHYYTEEAGNVF